MLFSNSTPGGTWARRNQRGPGGAPDSTISCLSPGANAFISPGPGSSPGAQTSRGVVGALKIHPDVCSASSGSPRAFKSKRCPSTNVLGMSQTVVCAEASFSQCLLFPHCWRISLSALNLKINMSLE